MGKAGFLLSFPQDSSHDILFPPGTVEAFQGMTGIQYWTPIEFPNGGSVDVDNPTYIFTKPRVGYRMPNGKMPELKSAGPRLWVQNSQGEEGSTVGSLRPAFISYDFEATSDNIEAREMTMTASTRPAPRSAIR